MLLPGGEIETHLNRRAGVQRRADLAGQPCPHHRRRIAQGSVTPDELSPVAAESPRRIVHVEKGDAVGEFGVVRIPRKQCAAGRINFGDQVQGRLWPQITQHPFHIAGGRQPPRLAR